MKKPARLAAAFALLATPAFADQCDTYTKSRLYSVPAPNGEMVPYFTITNTIDVPKEKICISLQPANDLVKSIQFDDSNPYCFKLGADAPEDQLMTPIVTFKDGNISVLSAMTLEGAKQAFSALEADCLTPKGQPTFYRDKSPKFQPL